MLNEGHAPSPLQERIREVQAELTRLQREEQELTRKEYDEVLNELHPMINKCFRRSKRLTNGHTLWEYCVIVAYPPLEITRTRVMFNKYQLPCIRFHYSQGYFYPANTAPPGNDDDVFHFDYIFTGELPVQYQNGAHDSRDLNYLWEECTHYDFINAAEDRYRQFIRKIFEPTTPPL